LNPILKQQNANKMEELPSHKQMFLLFHSHVSAQIGNHDVIRDDFANTDEILITMLER
jgi:hypothetical protein